MLRLSATAVNSVAPYFLEEVRKELEARYGAKALYQNGLTVQTALDLKLQDAANRALDEGIRRVDHIHGLPQAAPQRRRREAHRRELQAPALGPPVRGQRHHPGRRRRHRRGRRSIFAPGDYRVPIDKKGFAWTRKTSPSQLVRRGDLVEAKLLTLDQVARTATASIEQPPNVEGAVLAIDNRTGQIKAMVGGYSFERSKFNRATQALRQVGSAFKPFVYTAAIDRGYTPTTMLQDSPVTYPGGPGQGPYAPQNYEKDFWGPVTMRRALEHSRNVPAIKLMDALGPKQVIAYARRFGLTAPLPPYLPIALGAGDETLIEMTSAYSVFPNQGVRMVPYSVLKVTDREGNLLEENRPEPQDAIRADTAYVMTSLLRGVVEHGTAVKADGAELARRRQDRHDRRLQRRLVRRLRSRHHARRVGRLRPEKAARPRHVGRRSRAADLGQHLQGPDRRPQGPAQVRGAGQHRLRRRSTSCPAARPATARPAPSPKPSSPARNPGPSASSH